MGVIQDVSKSSAKRMKENDFFAWIVCAGIDLISGVSCKAPYEWVDKTDSEWAFNSRDRETFRVSNYKEFLLEELYIYYLH